MAGDFKSALVKANVISALYVEQFEERQEKLEHHVSRQIEMRHNVSSFERIVGVSQARNRYGERIAFLRWYLAQHLPLNLRDLCFFCGEEGVDKTTTAHEILATQIVAELLACTPLQKNYMIAEVKRRRLSPIDSYFSQIPEVPEDIRDFCYGLGMQVCGACVMFSAACNS
jgi:hypothetical protein